MRIDDIKLIERLKVTQWPVDVVLDTDTYNEIDDQFALSYILCSPEEMNLKAITVAPFKNYRAATPAIGMERSYAEVMNLLTLSDREELKEIVYKGSTQYLPDENTYVESEAARQIVKLALEQPSENPLYVIAIGAITNVASALLMEPKIADKIVVVWLGGHAHFWPNNFEFNCKQDVTGARVVFNSAAPLVQLPCMGVVSAFTTTKYEIVHHLSGKNKLCDYLVKAITEEAVECRRGDYWSKPIWDVCAVGWLMKGEFMESQIVSRPVPQYDHRWSFDDNRPPMGYVYYIHRDRLFGDLVEKLGGKAEKTSGNTDSVWKILG